MTKTAEPPLRVTIAIPTYRRPERLGLLLDALPARRDEIPELEVDILVVDNDPEGSGEQATSRSPLPLRYVQEPTPGIAAVRNRVLDECGRSDLIAFIDDDEIPREHWLSSLIATWQEHRSTAVMGRVISVFDDDVDPWVVSMGTFFRPAPPTGTQLEAAASGNLLLDASQVRRLGVRFDVTLGLGGGEDTHFSHQLVERGGTIVFCAESEAEDHVVAERLTRAWALQRAYSFGNTSALLRLRRAGGTSAQVLLKVRTLGGGVMRMAIGALRHLIGRALGDLRHDARGLRAHHRGRGMIAAAFGHHFEEYSRENQESL
jgi:hypothetical protein